MARKDKAARGPLTLLGALGAGAGIMYAFDPDRGSRRRAMLRDKLSHLVRSQSEVFDKGMRDLSHRTAGLGPRIRQALRSEQISDDVLVERVRARMGRCISHAGSIDVRSQDGVVTLAGPIFAEEVDDLLRAVRHVRGVRGVHNHLAPHRVAERVPGLQGQARARPRPWLSRDVWPPATRLVATGTGLALGAYGVGRKGIVGSAATLAGGALVVRAASNMPARRLFGIGPGRRAIELRKSIIVHAPIEQVFDFWSKLDNFPRFMDHVREVHVIPDTNRSHWRVQGFGGRTPSFDAEVTNQVKNSLFAWRTLPGSDIEHAGVVRFEPVGEHATRLHIRMTYNPPAGAVGHAVATLFRSDPKTALDDDLVRMKSLLEEGKARAHGERVTLDQLH